MDYTISINQTKQLKGIAIIFIIFGHLHLIENAGTYGVSLFLILSGYGLTYSFYRNGLTYFFKKKLSKILIPYSIVTLMWIITDRFLGIKYTFMDMATSLIGLNFRAVIDNSMWYIPYIILCYLAFYIIFKLHINKWIRVILLFVGSLILFVISNKIFANVGADWYVLQFPLGVFFGIISNECIVNNKLNYIFLNVAVLVISVVVFILTVNETDKLVFNMICFNSLSFGLLSLSLLTKGFTFKALEFIGGISYELYLFEAVFMWKYKFIFNLIEHRAIAILSYLCFIIAISITFKTIINSIYRGYNISLMKSSVSSSFTTRTEEM